MINRLFYEPLTPENSIKLDLSAKNKELKRRIYSKIDAFCAYMEEKLGAKYGVGGYLEHRIIYEAHENFATNADDFRNIHLGIDLWAPAGTPVFAPLAGIVHSYQVNRGSGNYGPTIILYHPAENIYSLYGHLGMEDMAEIDEGMTFDAGELLCHLGNSDENGGWPPHLHFQLIRDMQGFHGDYPGVCSKRDVAFYAENCPDPMGFSAAANSAPL
jgi:murein DD-endopeptidase MepM/ murein hydrolase activator NlpD